MSAPDWTTRVRPALNSRHFSVILAGFIIITNGLALFLVDDVAAKTLFFSNVFVWWIGAHSVLGFVVSAAMAIHLWQWRMEQLGVFFILFGVSLVNVFLASYMSIATYSAAPIFVKIVLWMALTAYLYYFSGKNFKAFSNAWHDVILKKHLLVEKDDHIIFLQLNEAKIREKIGFKLHSNPKLIVIFIIAGLATFFVRAELTAFFNVNWVPIAYAIMAIPLSTLGVMMITLGWQYFLYSHLLKIQTKKIVFLDNISKSYNKVT